MTSLMSGLSRIKEDEATEFRLLRNYLVHNDIPKGLQQKIVRFLQNQHLGTIWKSRPRWATVPSEIDNDSFAVF